MGRVCVSSCLAGLACRYDGASKPVDLSEWGEERVAFCPECAAGFGCPREPIEWVKTASGEERVWTVRTKRDVTAALRAACEAQARALRAGGPVEAFVLKSRSPSCGLACPLHDEHGAEIGTTEGMWVRVLRETWPGVRIVHP